MNLQSLSGSLAADYLLGMEECERRVLRDALCACTLGADQGARYRRGVGADADATLG